MNFNLNRNFLVTVIWKDRFVEMMIVKTETEVQAIAEGLKKKSDRRVRMDSIKARRMPALFN